jgi:mannose-6-phosphate isomerase-like protein (cupin superfamily)
MIAGKIWGSTQNIEANASLEFHRIDIVKGGTCSKHIHKHKWNGFFVESGKLKISVWKSYDLVDVTILTAGQYTKVAPGEFHQFEALEPTIAFEIYWTEFNHDDIERDTVGYVK